MVFANDFLTIASGKVETLNEQGEVVKTDNFGPGNALKYKIL